MTGAVPPTIETPKTVIGVGTRELVILGASAIVTILVILMPMGLIIKVGLAALILGSGALLAIGRAPTSGKTFEAYLLDLWRFYTRGRFLQRGAGEVRTTVQEVKVEQPRPRRSDINRIFQAETVKGLVKVTPLPLSWTGFFSVLSLSFLAMLLIWIWTGGMQEFLLRFGIVF